MAAAKEGTREGGGEGEKGRKGALWRIAYALSYRRDKKKETREEKKTKGSHRDGLPRKGSRSILRVCLMTNQ